jgi:CheY-like chemotaxis protein
MAKPVQILLADNDPDDLQFFREALEKTCGNAFKLAYVHDGEELLNYLSKTDKYHGSSESLPDMIFLDLNMPLLDGISALRKMQEDEVLRKIPVFILSSSYNLEDLKTCNQLGCYGFFTKSGNRAKLTKQIEGAVSSIIK